MTGIDIRGDEAHVSGLTVPLSNTGKVLFPADGITKGELIEYYGQVADWMLPSLRDHPIAMARFPDGITRQRIRLPHMLRKSDADQGNTLRAGAPRRAAPPATDGHCHSLTTGGNSHSLTGEDPAAERPRGPI